MQEYRVVMQDLPCSIRGFILYDSEGFPTIVLNARLSRAMNQRTLKHEMCHLRNNDAYSNEPIRKVERRADAFASA